MASRFEDEFNIEQVGQAIGDEKGDRVVDGRALEPEFVAERFVEGRANGMPEDVDHGPMKEEGRDPAGEVFPELNRPVRGRVEEGFEFGNQGGVVSQILRREARVEGGFFTRK